VSAPADIAAALSSLAPRLVSGGIGIEGLVRLSGGASQETYAFAVTAADGPSVPLILRRSPNLGARSNEAIGLANEAALIGLAGVAGAPVPPVVHVCREADGLGEAFIMGRVEGETLARRILRDAEFAPARAVLAGQCGAALARIHAVPHASLPEGLPVSDGPAQLARYRDIYRGFGARRPVMELAFSWLARHAPPPRPLTLVHGDFRNGNLMVSPGGLAAVLDWELAHVGDPREDLGWICVNSWRFGASHNPVGGFGSRADLLAGYAGAGGAPFSEEELRWFEVLGTLKWGVMCLIMYSAYATGADPSVERAMIGRRASETEIDLLNLLSS
jgi:aminoglycoside phosphotransferase (APT) family kinase protein